MSGYKFLDNKGTFILDNPENTGYLYFPVAGENGLKGAVTPTLGGDLKVNQNVFLMQPASVEDLTESKVSRNFWCIMEDGSFYSVAGASAKAESQRFTREQEKSSITAGFMWQTLTRELGESGLTAEVTSFVPISDENAECMYVKIRNTSDVDVTFTPVAAVPIYGRSADNLRDHRHVTSLLHRIYTTEEGVFVKPTLSFDERGHQVNDLTYFVTGLTGTGEKPVGFCPVVEDFTGEGGSYYQPKSIVKNAEYDASGKEYAGYEAIGALKFHKITIAPGAETAYIIRIGVDQNLTDTTKVNSTLRTKEDVEKALAETREYWLSKVNVSYHTGDVCFDDFMFWVSFQPILRRIYGCSFLPHHDYGKGGRGWRDLWQDCLALLIMNPDGVRQMLIDNYGGVRMDGSNATIIGSKQGEFIADRNNITRVWMDHGFWPLLTTKFYIDQTGDVSVLLKENSYFKDRQEMRGTATDDTFSKEDSPLLKDVAGNHQSLICIHKSEAEEAERQAEHACSVDRTLPELLHEERSREHNCELSNRDGVVHPADFAHIAEDVNRVVYAADRVEDDHEEDAEHREEHHNPVLVGKKSLDRDHRRNFVLFLFSTLCSAVSYTLLCAEHRD